MLVRKILRRPLCLTAFTLVILASFSVSAAIIDIEKSGVGPKPFLNELLSDSVTVPDAGIGSALVISGSPEQDKQLIDFIVKNFRRTGNIAINSQVTSNINKLTSADSLRYLLAISLVVSGDISSAKDQVAGLKLKPENRLFDTLLKALIAKASGQYKSAITLSKKAISIDESHAYAYNLLGQLYFIQKKNKLAIKNFKLAIAKAPEFSAAYSNLGGAMYVQGDIEESILSYNNAIKLTPTFCPALIGRSAIWMKMGDHNNSIKDLETCIQNNSDQLLATKRLIELYLLYGKLDEADKLAKASFYQDSSFSRLTQADILLRQNKPSLVHAQLDPLEGKSAQGSYLLSIAFAIENNFANAHKSLSLAKKMKPDSAALKLAGFIYKEREGKKVNIQELKKLIKKPVIGSLAAFVAGNIEAGQSNYKNALLYWSQAKDLLPGFVMTGLSPSQVRASSKADEQRFISMGMLLYLKSYYVAALAEFEKAIALNHNSFMANFLAALTLTQQGKNDQVSKYLSSSISKAPSFFPANYMLAEQSLKTGKIKDAIKYYLRASESYADQGVLIKLGMVYEGEDQVNQAISTYQRFIEHHKDSFVGYNQLAWLYAKRGKKLDEALKLASKANKLRPENASINDTLGWIYFQKKNYKKANKYLHNANKISNGKNPDILYHLAALQYRQGDMKAAKKNLEYALSLNKNFESGAEARKLLSAM